MGETYKGLAENSHQPGELTFAITYNMKEETVDKILVVSIIGCTVVSR